MTVGTPTEFISLTIDLWGPHNSSFKVKQSKELMGKLNHIAFGAPWLKYLFGNIYTSLAMALYMNN